MGRELGPIRSKDWGWGGHLFSMSLGPKGNISLYPGGLGMTSEPFKLTPCVSSVPVEASATAWGQAKCWSPFALSSAHPCFSCGSSVWVRGWGGLDREVGLAPGVSFQKSDYSLPVCGSVHLQAHAPL